MGSDQIVTMWALAHRKKLNLKITKYTWVEELLPEYTDIRVIIKIFGRDFKGRAIDQSENKALAKALTEALERCTAFSIGLKNSNGVAAHYDIVKAHSNAKLELIERDALMCHHLTNTPCIELLNVIEKFPLFNQINKFLNSRSIHLKFYKTLSMFKHSTIFCVANGVSSPCHQFGLAIGSACSYKPSRSIEKAALETFQNLAFRVLLNGGVSISLNQFNQTSKPGPIMHQSLAYNTNSVKNYKFLDSIYSEIFLPDKNITNAHPQESEIKFETKRLIPNDSFLKTAPIFVVQARSENLQRLTFGPINTLDINTKRLAKFSGVSNSKINTFPHPLG